MSDDPGTPHICVCNMDPHLDGHTRMPLPSLTIERLTPFWGGVTAADRSEMPPTIQRFVSDWIPLPGKGDA